MENAIGAEIVGLLKKDIPTQELVDAICDKYDVDKALFERDLEEFTLQLKEHSILE